MRTSTLQFYKKNLSLLNKAQQRVLDQQVNVATGMKIRTPADAPVESARIALLQERISVAESFQSNARYASSALSFQENNLNSVEDSLQRLIEIQLEAGNASYGEQEREALEAEAQEIFDFMLTIANSKDINGNYIYAGSTSRIQPFQQGSGNDVTYHGNDNYRTVGVTSSTLVPVSESGNDLFMDIENGFGDFTVTTGFNQATSTDPEWPFREVLNSTTIPTFPAALPHTNAGTKTIDVEVSDPDLYVESIDDYFIHIDTTSFAEVRYSVYDSEGNAVIQDERYNVSEPIVFNGMEVNFSENGDIMDDDIFHISPTPRQSVFETLNRMITNLQRPVATNAERDIVNEENEELLFQLNHAALHFSNQRAVIGTRYQSVNMSEVMNEEMIFTSTSVISYIRDTDIIEAASQLNTDTLSLQAAQQSFARVQQLSLFNFL